MSKIASESCKFRKSLMFNSFADFSSVMEKHKPQWLLIDARDVVLGRLASFVVRLLQGKHKACYTPFYVCGDRVLVINARHVRLTGNKLENKVYHRHTQYPGGLKTTTPKQILESSQPERLLRLAVKRMLSKGAMGLRLLKNLHIYSDGQHKHQAQKPEMLNLPDMCPTFKRVNGK